MLALIVIAGAYWWFHPAINIHSTDFWGFVFIVILLPLFLVFWMRSKQYQTGTKEVTKNEGKAKTFRILSFVPVAVVALVAIGALMSMAIFPGNAEYSNVLKTDTLEFAQDIKEVNYSEIPVIDPRFRHFAGQPRDGLHPRVRQPVPGCRTCTRRSTTRARRFA